MRWAIVVALVCLPVMLCSASAPAEQPTVDERLGAQLPPDLPLIDSTGTEHRLDALLGERATVLVPAYYTCPQLCGLNLHGISRAIASMPDLAGDEGIRLLAVSFDPRDDPAAAADRRAGLASETPACDWTFTVMPAGTQERLLEHIGWSVVQDPNTGEYAHPIGAVILTDDGRIARYTYGLAPEADELRLALVEAGQGSIGSATDQLLLLCYRYDPAERRYGLFVGNVLRIGALSVMACAAIGLFWAVRRVKRRGRGAA